MNIFTALRNDENGFIVSAEIVLVGTILVLGVIVGLTELSFGVNQELEDLGSAVGSANQSYYYSLASGKKGHVHGSIFQDYRDECDSSYDISCDSRPRGE
ncbi:MAG TPA: branched-chain amino acid aminotransferase [Planctomycetes bacterium]|nr:branched-chain amino acid aminotransferase [Fuerstiella sp.]HIK90728.1 branched-chain amino acid aminotransferase [Planctomycetota bacterium]